MRHKIRNLTTSMMALALASCASVDTYVPVDLPADITAPKSFTYALNSGQNFTPNWWVNFQDPKLVYWVETALEANRDIKTAQVNVRTAELLIKSAKLGKSYTTDTTVGADYGRSLSASEAGASLSGGLGASWELDVFDRLDSPVAAAEFNRDAFVQLHRDVAVIVASDTAQAYLDYLGSRARLNVAEKNAEAQNKTLQLVKNLVENGRSSDLDLHRSEALYRTTLSTLPEFEADSRIATAQLAALTGQSTALVRTRLNTQSQSISIPQHNGDLVSGAPNGLIERRPDIRQAAANISRQFALTEFEKSRLYPRFVFNLDGSTLFNSANVLSTAGNLAYSLGGLVSWEGPDLRSVRTDIAISKSETEAAVREYEQVVFEAMSDVESSLASYGQELRRKNDLRLAAQAAENALELATLRFDEGFDDFLDVLDAQRTLFDAEDEVVQHKILVTTYAISVYRALGGMWTDEELLTSPSLIKTATKEAPKRDFHHDA